MKLNEKVFRIPIDGGLYCLNQSCKLTALGKKIDVKRPSNCKSKECGKAIKGYFVIETKDKLIFRHIEKMYFYFPDTGEIPANLSMYERWRLFLLVNREMKDECL